MAITFSLIYSKHVKENNVIYEVKNLNKPLFLMNTYDFFI